MDCSNFGEGSGTPLQYSCLENPMGGGAWWAVVHGVAQSWTRLQQLSSEYLQYGNTILSFCILSSDLAVSTYNMGTLYSAFVYLSI